MKELDDLAMDANHKKQMMKSMGVKPEKTAAPKAAKADPIKIKPANKGKLHEKLGVPQGKPIPEEKLAKAKKSKSPALRKEATFAENAKHFDH